ncbi:MAG: DUF1273 domain-containing protein [Ruminococcaceae bacterium]|nr:DUF1273 domain-containing protein [Oscillospiraceae bacterium]
MLKKITCCFTGHRIMPADLKTIQSELRNYLCSLINDGFIYFGSGGALGFDMLAAETVLQLKKSYPHIKLSMILPCPNQDRFWTQEQKNKYKIILTAADEIIYTSDTYYKGCMQKRNRCLVDSASCVLAYLERNTGGTKYTVDYANKTGVNVQFLLSSQMQGQQLSFC